MGNELDLAGAEEMADPAVSARRLRDLGRCPRYARFDPPFHIVSGYDDVCDVLRDPATFLSGHGQGPNFTPPVGLVSDPPMHTFFRELVQPWFQPRAIAAREPRLRAIAEALLDRVLAQPVWDVHDDLAFPLPVTVICEIFGIPTDDIDQFKRWSDASVAALSSQHPQSYAADVMAMQAYVGQRLQALRGAADDGLLLWQVANCRRDGAWLPIDEAVGLVLQLFVAGNETTTSLITNLVWRFLSEDGLWPALVAGEIDLDRAINESLRFDPPLLGLFRTTSRTVTIGEVTVPAGTKIMTHYGAANRDATAFAEPDRFDPYRQGRKVLSFGLGIHVCLGMELARLEARVTLDCLRRRFPRLHKVDDGERIGPFLFWGRRHLPVAAGDAP
ncbi:MAG: cytochrome P450 [Pseudomonadales bacterium]|nr:cytochrome P450 [Pseudomonadales bacterium]MCP5184958.1 cytochrome P450 [Pseudomonadales bacterium]